MKEVQEDAAEKLLYILPNYMAKIRDSPEVSEEHIGRIQELKNLLKQEWFLPTDLLEFRTLFSRYARFRMFKVNSLIHMAHFMSIKPVTGLNTINNILSIFKVKIPKRIYMFSFSYQHSICSSVLQCKSNTYLSS